MGENVFDRGFWDLKLKKKDMVIEEGTEREHYLGVTDNHTERKFKERDIENDWREMQQSDEIKVPSEFA